MDRKVVLLKESKRRARGPNPSIYHSVEVFPQRLAVRIRLGGPDAQAIGRYTPSRGFRDKSAVARELLKSGSPTNRQIRGGCSCEWDMVPI